MQGTVHAAHCIGANSCGVLERQTQRQQHMRAGQQVLATCDLWTVWDCFCLMKSGVAMTPYTAESFPARASVLWLCKQHSACCKNPCYHHMLDASLRLSVMLLLKRFQHCSDSKHTPTEHETVKNMVGQQTLCRCPTGLPWLQMSLGWKCRRYRRPPGDKCHSCARYS